MGLTFFKKYVTKRRLPNAQKIYSIKNKLWAKRFPTFVELIHMWCLFVVKEDDSHSFSKHRGLIYVVDN